MSVTTTNRAPEVPRRWDEAAQKGLGNAAQVLTNAVRDAFGSDYYLGGQYRNTAYIKQSIRYLTPYKGADGLWETQVGSSKMVALYWEVGWTHKHSGVRYHVPIWAPTGRAQTEPMRAAFARAAARVMGSP